MKALMSKQTSRLTSQTQMNTQQASILVTIVVEFIQLEILSLLQLRALGEGKKAQAGTLKVKRDIEKTHLKDKVLLVNPKIEIKSFQNIYEWQN